jgi:hypothetical protein
MPNHMRRTCARLSVICLVLSCAREESVAPGGLADLKALAAISQTSSSRWQVDSLALRIQGDVVELDLHGLVIADSALSESGALVPFAFLRKLPTSIDAISADGSSISLVSYKIEAGSWLVVGTINRPLSIRGLQRVAPSPSRVDVTMRFYYPSESWLNNLLPAVPTGDSPSPVRIAVSRTPHPFTYTKVVTQRSQQSERLVPLTTAFQASAVSKGVVSAKAQSLPSGLWMFSSARLADLSTSEQLLWRITLLGPLALLYLSVWFVGWIGLRYLSYRALHLGQEGSFVRFWREEPSLRSGKVLFLLVTAVMLLLLLIAIAKTVSATASPLPHASPAALLSDMQLQFTASTEALESNRIGVSWRFRPVASTGDSSMIGLRVEAPLAVIHSGEGTFGGAGAHQQLYRLPGGGHAVRVRIPARSLTLTPALRLLNNPLFRSRQIVLQPAHATAFDSIAVVGVSASVSNVVTKKDRWGLRFVHAFPLDGYTVVLPLSFESQAILDRIAINGPAAMDGTIGIDNLTYSFTQTGADYLAHLDASSGEHSADSVRVVLAPGEQFVLRADFRRSFLQRYGLLVTPIVLSILAGVWIGRRPLRKRLKTLALLLPVPGVLASLWFFRATVLGHYQQLPQLIPLEGITLFELVVIGSWLLMWTLIAILARKQTPH